METSFCSICKKEDKTLNLIQPCKCEGLVHKSCLNKQRISDSISFLQCQICGATYKTQTKEDRNCRKNAILTSLVLVDVFVFLCSFVLISFLIQKSINQFNIQLPVSLEKSKNVGLIGAIVFFLIISFVFGSVNVIRGKTMFLNGIDCRDDNAFLMVVTMGVFVLIFSPFHWIIKSSADRFGRHRRYATTFVSEVVDYSSISSVL